MKIIIGDVDLEQKLKIMNCEIEGLRRKVEVLETTNASLQDDVIKLQQDKLTDHKNVWKFLGKVFQRKDKSRVTETDIE